jgi:nucleoside-triphosphatase THEP1
MRKKLLILTGPIGIGKSTITRKVYELAVSRGYKISGVISPPLYDENGIKVGFFAEDISSGERWILGRNDNAVSLKGPVWGKYTFSEEGFEKAVRALKRAHSDGCDLLILDEVGPLELLCGKGFRPFLELLTGETVTNLLIVVRPSLIKEVLKVLNRKDIALFHADIENRDRLPANIVDELRHTVSSSIRPRQSK